MNYSTKVYLDVAYEEKGKVKALGAKWDPHYRCWYAPEQSELAPFERWLPNWVLEPGDTIRLDALLLPTTCYRCHRAITCLIGLRLPEHLDVEPSGALDEDVAYLSVEDCGGVVDLLLDPTVRAELTIGPLLYRSTRVRPEGYLANTCEHCGATQGEFPVGEELLGFLGGDPSRIPLLWSDGLAVDYPLGALRDRQGRSTETDLVEPPGDHSTAVGEAEGAARPAKSKTAKVR